MLAWYGANEQRLVFKINPEVKNIASTETLEVEGCKVAFCYNTQVWIVDFMFLPEVHKILFLLFLTGVINK